jgi:hypothetical protein
MSFNSEKFDSSSDPLSATLKLFGYVLVGVFYLIYLIFVGIAKLFIYIGNKAEKNS